LQNLNLITEAYHGESKQLKLVGLFLDRDVDYRTLLLEIENRYEEEELPEQKYIAEEIALHYCRMVIKAMINGLSNYSAYDSSLFEELTD
jgi:hypothetical protein